MKPISLTSVITFTFSFLFGIATQAQTFGTSASAVWISDCNQSNYFNTSGAGATLVGPPANVFSNANLGVHTQNSGTLILRGGEVKTFKTGGVSNVCGARMYYRIYPQTSTPGSFNSIDLVFMEECAFPSNVFPSGGTCVAGQQKWSHIVPDGATVPYSPVNLTSFAPGNYVLEVYYDITGSSTNTTQCDETNSLNNSGNNYKASFSIQAPVLASTNPTTCNGTEGSITINGLAAGATYSISYSDDGTGVAPASFVSNGSGQVLISGLNAGIYSDFELLINGCTTQLFTGLILSNPVFTPTFPAITPFCAGSTPPLLSTTSNNGIAGTWSPSLINNMASASYTFTPTAGQCGLPVTKNVVVRPIVTPTFSFGTSRTICAGGSVPALPSVSSENISGAWSPSVVDNQASATYTFTPAAGQCAAATSFTLTVTPNITPTFGFGTSLTICSGAAVPLLPASSDNGISGTWSPSAVDNTNSGVYTFTPSAGQCATAATFTVTVTPNVTPAFSFGTAVTICNGATAPGLPSTSDNGITGTWNPATIDNQASGTYTFTPTAGQCALSASLTVTVSANITPTFSFGTTLTICQGGTVPTLATTSTDNITGTWSPAVVDNQSSGTYTFTPTAGQCALATTFTVTVAPNITPAFSFGTTLTICAGASVPALPTTSDNNISGTWNPSVVDNQASGSYTFTPTAGQCAVPATFSVTVNPNITPTFSFGTSLTICAGGTVPALPNTSDNAVTGIWSPSVVDNQTSGVYNFTPGAGQCALPTTYTVTVTPNITPSFSFGTTLTICAGGSVPVLPTTSDNSITGTWSPSIVDNQTSGTYNFTPGAGQCALQITFTVTVNPIVTPTFSFGTSRTICAGGSVPALPSVSSENISGAWSPSVVDNQASATYTFTPAAGQCATATSFTLTVTPNITPTFGFGTSLTICSGAAVPLLPTSSDNGISGTWSPSAVDNTNSGVYTFTPSAGQCATTATFTVTVTPNVTPAFSFGTAVTICNGATAPGLPSTSDNGITGTWNPATIDNQASGTYTFTPTAGQCALSSSLTVTVSANITPTFSFGTTLTICQGGTVPTLATTSTDNITGTWSPAVVDNQSSGTYTFTPTAGQCALATTFTVTVTPNITPAFSFGTTLTICAGASVPALPTTSDNNISGTWNPSVVDNQASGSYTFTPTAGQCAVPATFSVTVNPNVTPTFSFGTSLTICDGATVPALPATSNNGISGSWSPSTVNNNNSDVYTFTPSSGQCATTATFSVTVNPIVTPVFAFGTTLTICAGSGVPSLPAASDNNITGTWTPSIVDNQASATYSFTPAAGSCATPTTFTVTVTPTLTPTFNFGTTLIICTNSIVPELPATSENGIAGVWSPAIVSNQISAVYTFTPTSTPEQCITTTSFTVTVNPILTPTFSFGTTLTVCAGATVLNLPTTSTNGVVGTWSPATISNQASGIYTFTSAPGQCATETGSLAVTVNPVGEVNPTTDITVTDGATVPLNTFTGSPATATFNWSNTNTAIGLGASGTGNVPPFTAVNKTDKSVSATITVTPMSNNCPGSAKSYVLTINPLDKDVFVPNVFSPNGDGKNEVLLVYGNYISKLEMRIFNQWGEQVALVTDKNKGWDGRNRGKAQPVGVYVYTLKAIMNDGRTVNLKGYITLLR